MFICMFLKISRDSFGGLRLWNPSSQDKSREIVMEDVVVPAFEDVDSVPEVRNQIEYVRVPDTHAAWSKYHCSTDSSVGYRIESFGIIVLDSIVPTLFQ